MRDSVRAAFISFTAPLEGVVRWMYLDVKGLVTVAIGNLIDPVDQALGLPFVRASDGSTATRREIAAEWLMVKKHPTAAKLGHRVLEQLTHLRLTDVGVEEVVLAKLDFFDGELAKRFRHYPDWPADAQLATLSMAWACGQHFHFPHLAAALNAADFETAERECTIAEKGNPGIPPRNRANRILYLNAAAAVREQLNPDTLFWPRDLGIEDAPPTQRIVDFAIVHAMPGDPEDGAGG